MDFMMSVVLIYVFLLVTLLASGIWIGIAIGFVGCFALLLLSSGGLNQSIGMVVFNGLHSFTMTAVPLFIFMGCILIRCGISERLYAAASLFFKRIPGNLLHSNVLSSAIFASISGSTMATTATIASVAVPVMEKNKYNMHLALGSICASGTLGLMIPPSLTFIVYGAITGTSVGKLFIAGIFPGILIAVLFMSYILIHSLIYPQGVIVDEKEELRKGLASLRRIWPVAVLIFGVLGTIYLGVCTPTEAAGLGATGAIIIAIILKTLTKVNFVESLNETIRITSMVMLIFIGTNILSVSLANLGIPTMIISMITGLDLSPFWVLAAISLMYIILGCFLDGLALMLTTLPVVYPIVVDGLNCDPIWFGVVMTLYAELSAITPPVGANLFVLQGASKYPLGTIVRGVIPFFIMLCIILVALAIWPQIALFLPTRMGQ